jgi:nucleotide-binding universal stress UspA family protein
MKSKTGARSASASESPGGGAASVGDSVRKSAGWLARVKRILVPLDFSDCSFQALDHALALAEEFRATLILLHVVEPDLSATLSRSGHNAMDEGQENQLEEWRERLAKLVQKRVGHHIPVETLVRIGRAHSEIPDTAKALGANLIVIGTHGATGQAAPVLGGTAERVLRHACCPVLTVCHRGAV